MSSSTVHVRAHPDNTHVTVLSVLTQLSTRVVCILMCTACVKFSIPVRSSLVHVYMTTLEGNRLSVHAVARAESHADRLLR